MKKRFIFGVIVLFLFLVLFFPGAFSAIRYLAYEEARYYSITGPDYYKPSDAYNYHYWGNEQVPRVRPSPICNLVYGQRINCGNTKYYYQNYYWIN